MNQQMSNGPLSPSSIGGLDDWSPTMSRYDGGPYAAAGPPRDQLPANVYKPYPPPPGSAPQLQMPPPGRGNLITPPASASGRGSSSTNAMDPRGPPPQGGQPSPPSSVARSSMGTGPRAPSVAGSIDSRRAYLMEESLAEHYHVLKNFLGASLVQATAARQNDRAQAKLLRLTLVQFQELSTDVYDELLRREDQRAKGGPNAPNNDTPRYLLPKSTFHFKRNQARQKLSTLPTDRFRLLATDVYFELERRYPRFGGGDVDRSASPAPSTASSRRAPSSVGGGSMVSMGGGPGPYRGPPGMRPGMPPGPNGYPPRRESVTSQRSMGGDLGRPLPKTFQSNTIVPNKSTMVEDDDEPSGVEDEDDQMSSFGLEGAARRGTETSMGDPQSKMVEEYRSQITQLEEKVDGLEANLREKVSEIDELRAFNKDREDARDKERAEWSNTRFGLERQVSDAQSLHDSLKSEIDKLRIENSDLATRSAPSPSADPQAMDALRSEAAHFLAEMRALTDSHSAAVDREEQLLQRVADLEADLKDWKTRYARARTQLRSVRTSSLGLSGSGSAIPDAMAAARDEQFLRQAGAVRDVAVSRWQLAIDDLLRDARGGDARAIMDAVKAVVIAVRRITNDLEASEAGKMAGGMVNGEAEKYAKQVNRLKMRVSAATNNLITASKNHASAAGVAPVSLLDAAASHLSTALVELLRLVGIRKADPSELDPLDDDGPTPREVRGYSSASGGSGNESRGYSSSYSTVPTSTGVPVASVKPLVNGHMRNLSRVSANSNYSTTSAGSRTYGSALRLSVRGMRNTPSWEANGAAPTSYPAAGYGNPYAAGYNLNDITEDHNGHGYASSPGASSPADDERRAVLDLKDYLEDRTAQLVNSIQPLVASIRARPVGSELAPQDAETVARYVEDIIGSTGEISTRARELAEGKRGPDGSQKGGMLAAVTKHLPPVVGVLEECGGRLGDELQEMRRRGDGVGRERVPPVAFRVARGTKELLLRVERIESGELTADMELSTDI